MKIADLGQVSRSDQLAHPLSRFMFTATEGLGFVSDVATASAGIQTGDNNRFHRCFWEVASASGRWVRFQRSATSTEDWTGMHLLLDWDGGDGALIDFVTDRLDGAIGGWIRGVDLWGSRGVILSRIGDVPATLYAGEAFSDNAVLLSPRLEVDLPALWAFCRAEAFSKAVRSVDQRLSVTPGTFLGAPLEIDHWRAVAAEEFPDGLPEPWSDDATQWLFEGRPEVAAESQALQVGVGRLLGFRWPEQEDADDLDELADDDGVVCLPSVRGEAPAAARLEGLLARAFGGTWSPGRTAELLAESGSKKKSLEEWLRDEYFKAHCKVFKNRPFIWHVWDGRKDGFSALVNYHRLNRSLLDVLTHSYLGDWIERQQAGVADGTAGAEDRLAAALDLKRRLELITKGEPPFDIFVRWKTLAEQPIGWDPDLDDGVRLNVRPFVEAGVLRAKFNVNWKPDSGKANDSHYTIADKQAARAGTSQ